MLFRFIYQMEKLSPWRIFPAPLMIANLRKRELVEIRWCKSDPSMQIDCNFEFLSKYKWKARNSTLCDLTKIFKNFKNFKIFTPFVMWQLSQNVRCCSIICIVSDIALTHGGLMCHLPLTPGQNGQNEFFSLKFDEKCL